MSAGSIAEGAMLMDEVRDVLARQHKSYKTVKAYTAKIVDFVRFTGAQKRDDLQDSSWVEKYLTHLAVNRRVSASTQNQAFYAVLFLSVKF